MQPELFKFAFFPTFDQSIEYLAERLADREEWDFSGSPTPNYPILKNYLEFTFRKLVAERKIAFTANNEFACFNTGLVTDNLEEIFALFEKHRNPRADSSPYVFQGFLKKSENRLLSHFSNDLPGVTNFFESPELLIFNPSRELIPDIDHIIEDNNGRFPMHLRTADSGEKRRQLVGAIDEAKRKAKTNYQIAVPQFYNGRVQLLLPLCLTPNSPNPDLALAVQKLNEHAYTARTVLTLRMAYSNARLIVKPQSSWLKP